MEFFNAFQLTCGLIGGPFFLNWLATQTFSLQPVAYCAAIMVYIVMCIVNTVSVAHSWSKL